MEEDIQKQLYELYLGSIAQRINLKRVKGSYYEYDKYDFTQDLTQEDIINTLQTRFPMKQLGESYQNLLIPCISAFDIRFSGQNKVKHSQQVSQPKHILQTPLIKVQENTDIQGFKSGKRSIIIKQNNKFYRLKGCGNLTQGFPVEKIDSRFQNTLEIRGCHFFNTVKRELKMTDEISQVLGQHEQKINFWQIFSILCANKSIGFWKYDQQFNQNEPELSNEFELVDKYCCLFETLSEKRVMTHLIQGINMILIAFLEVQKEQKWENILELFQKDRIKSGLPDTTPVDWIDVLLLEEQGGLQEKIKKNVFTDKNEEELVNLLKFFTNNKLNDEDKIQELCLNIQKMFKTHKGFDKLLIHLLETLQKYNLTQVVRQIAFIYGHIGYEIGKTLKIFFQNDINWGYYNDHDPFIFHCNAHPNNFVVIPQDLNQNNFLAPLDFDLCFYKKEYLNINYEDQDNYATNDVKTFESYQEQSRQNLELCLTGIEMMENFDFQTFDFKKLDIEIQQNYQIFHTALRDTMRIYYMRGFDLRNIETFGIPVQNELAHCLIKIALILTSEFSC